jgi:hypothetical protein
MPSLYHYTCDHRAPLVRADGLVVPAHHLRRDDGRPNPVALIPWCAFAWFTDLEVPIRAALGLTSDLVACDRTEYRFRAIEGARLVHWTDIRRRYGWAEILETAPGARPAHWYVSADPVPVIEAPQ